MSSKSSGLIRSDRSVKKTSDNQSKSKNQKSFIEINKTVVNRSHSENRNPFVNRNPRQTEFKQVEIEPRTKLLDKIKYLELEIER